MKVDGGLVGPNPYDELGVDTAQGPGQLVERIVQAMERHGPSALARWEPVLTRLRQDPEERWWLALMSRSGGEVHPLDRVLEGIKASHPEPARGPDAEALREHLKANLEDPLQRAVQLRDLIDLPELEADPVYEGGLSALDEE